jgi:uncharacterized membrane protein YphA (DoxX/SURF4 family)
MFKVEKVTDEKGRVLIQDPPIARFLFQNTLTSWLWLVVRVYVGYDFLVAGWHKFTTPAWMDGSGQGILGFWKGALGTTPSGAPIVTFDWYRSFLQYLVDTNSGGWFSYLIVFGELAVGAGLILGAFVGLAAAGGYHEYQSSAGRPRLPADPGLEERRLRRPGLLPAADARHAVEAIRPDADRPTAPSPNGSRGQPLNS